jgi:hypothetical protein
MQMIVTPRVRAEVRAHFGCRDLEGAELEDQGENGTALTHWEKRVFEVSQRPTCFLRISLAGSISGGFFNWSFFP